jgi:hypothetical protein
MERRRHWWNGTWGRLVRRDLYIYEDGGTWLVEARLGGGDGRSRWFDYADEDAALERVRDLMTESDDWREVH